MNKENLANAFIDGSLSDSATSVDLKAGYVIYQPQTPYFATITPFGELSTKANSEIVEVTNISGDTLTIVRGQRGTTAKNFSDGAIFSNGIYVEDLDDLAMTILKSTYPIGSTYWNASDSRNPSVIFGFGTWVALDGVVLGGVAGSGPFNVSAGTIIGADTHTLTEAEMPSHTHTQNSHYHSVDPPSTTTSSNGNHSHRQHIDTWMNVTPRDGMVPTSGAFNARAGAGTYNTYSAGAHTHTVNIAAFNSASTTATNQNTGGGGAHNNIQRTKVGYLWERTA